jgi:hypothetical protein
MPSCVLLREGDGEALEEIACSAADAADALGGGAAPVLSARRGAVQVLWQAGGGQVANPRAAALAGVFVSGDALAVVDAAATPAEAAREVEAALALPARTAAKPDAESCVVDVRQELMWTLAARATSMTWERLPPPPPVVTPTAAAPPPAASMPAPINIATAAAAPSAWAALPPELLGAIIAAADYSPTTARAVAQVSRSWRAAVAGDRVALQRLAFVRAAAPPAARNAPLPWLLAQAVRAGNPAAAVVAARTLEARGDCAGALPFWAKAKCATVCHPEAAARIGWAHYDGAAGVARDPEEAMLWLSRAAKALAAALAPPCAGAAPPPLPPLMGAAACARELAASAHMLALLHLDGEATRQDTSAAVRWLLLAREHGCAEAPPLLATLYRSGQY